MTILIGINKSITANTYYRIIFSIIIGLLFSFSSQIVFAQSTSTSAAADKGGGQYASNGDSFKDFLQKYKDGAIDEAGNLVDSEKWTEKDYDSFVKYQDKKDINAVVSLDQGIADGKKAVVSIDTTNAGKKATINQIASQNADIAQTATKVFPIYEQLLVKQGHLRSLSPEAKELIQVIAKYKRPPGFVEQAERFVKYIGLQD